MELNVRWISMPTFILPERNWVMRIRRHAAILPRGIVSKQKLRGQIHLTFLTRIFGLLLLIHHRLLFFVLGLLFIFRDIIYVWGNFWLIVSIKINGLAVCLCRGQIFGPLDCFALGIAPRWVLPFLISNVVWAGCAHHLLTLGHVALPNWHLLAIQYAINDPQFFHHRHLLFGACNLRRLIWGHESCAVFLHWVFWLFLDSNIFRPAKILF